MNRKGRNTSFDLRQLVIFNRAKGFSGDKISRILSVPRSTVYDILKRFEKENRIESIKQTGRPPKLSVQDERFIERTVTKNPKVTATMIATELNSRINSHVSPSTIRRVIRKKGFKSRIPRSKPLLSKVNIRKRLEFAQKYAHVNKNFWDDVIFTDESKFNLFGNDGKRRVWRKPNTALLERNLNPTVKHGGGSVMVWGCFSAGGVGSLEFIEGNMDSTMYVDILKKNLRASATKLGIESTYKFYQDNDPKHKSRFTREWLLYNVPKVLETPPPQSPDLNPIEHFWAYLEQHIRQPPTRKKQKLKDCLKEDWEKIPLDYLPNLVSSMPDCLQAVLEAKGGIPSINVSKILQYQ